MKKDQGIVAIVLDAKKEFGTTASVKVEDDGTQTAAIRVISQDGGFLVLARTFGASGDMLKPDDIVIWVPSVYSEQVAKGFGDSRAGWVGFVRAKVAAEMSVPDTGFRVICEYR